MAKVKVLFIDDSPERHLMVESVAIEEDMELIQARTVDEGLGLLDGDYHLVCIDHDLNDDKRNGTLIAKKIRKDKISIPFVWVHSANPVGAMRIYSILLQCNNVRAFVKEPFNFISLSKVFKHVNESMGEENE